MKFIGFYQIICVIFLINGITSRDTVLENLKSILRTNTLKDRQYNLEKPQNMSPKFSSKELGALNGVRLAVDPAKRRQVFWQLKNLFEKIRLLNKVRVKFGSKIKKMT